MRRIAEKIVMPGMGNGDMYLGAAPAHPVELLHHANKIVRILSQVLKDVIGQDFLELIVRHRSSTNPLPVKVADHLSQTMGHEKLYKIKVQF